MPIRFRCAYCNQLMGIARRKAGTVVRCPKCAGEIIVPVPEGPAGPEDAEPGGVQAFDVEKLDFGGGPDPATNAAPPQPAPAPTEPTPAPAPMPMPLPPGMPPQRLGVFVPIGMLIVSAGVVVLLLILMLVIGLIIGRASMVPPEGKTAFQSPSAAKRRYC